jgi:hypothetical protein
MGRLVEFGLPDGDSVLVEVAGTQLPTVRGMDGGAVAERAQMTFQAAVGRIKPAVQGMIGQLHELSDEPDEVQIEFGLDLHAEVGAFVAQASADANFSVVLTWHKDTEPDTEPGPGTESETDPGQSDG